MCFILGTLEALDIPPLDLNQNFDKLDMIPERPVSNSPNLRTASPQPVSICEGFGDQSNSEDSSLSDSDRTLVGDAPGKILIKRQELFQNNFVFYIQAIV